MKDKSGYDPRNSSFYFELDPTKYGVEKVKGSEIAKFKKKRKKIRTNKAHANIKKENS
jgi:hypothetical protein